MLLLLLITGCVSQYPNQQVVGKQFPTITGESLEKKEFVIPSDFNTEKTLLLIG
jgi:hypothetical protein